MLAGSELQALREEIESIDRELLQLLRRRMQHVEKVAAWKIRAAFPFRDHQREELVLQRVRKAAIDCGLDAHMIENLYRLIMEMSISHQQAYVRSLDSAPLRVAYQGVEGSYSHLTAQRRYGQRPGGSLLTGFESIYEAARLVKSGEFDVALLPIENSTAGSINETYDILAEVELVICSEVVSQVRHCLIALPGATVESLRQVYSHPQAILQCDAFLRTVPWIKAIAEFDTAGAARKVKEGGDPTVAAIASESAATMLDLKVLKKSIQTQKENATRFVEVAIEASPCPPDKPCKTSLMLILDKDPVTLGEVLNQFGRRGIGLTKLESRPIPSTAWKYRFYLDVDVHANSQKMTEALADVRPLTAELRLLGTYPQAEPAWSQPGLTAGGDDGELAPS